MVERPWGTYETLSEAENHKVKRIVVNKGHRLSLQRHKHRAEHWFIVSGNPRITIDTQEFLAFTGRSFDIPAGTLHRIHAVESDVVFIEVQTGTYFGEDDIERLEDDYNR